MPDSRVCGLPLFPALLLAMIDREVYLYFFTRLGRCSVLFRSTWIGIPFLVPIIIHSLESALLAKLITMISNAHLQSGFAAWNGIHVHLFPGPCQS